MPAYGPIHVDEALPPARAMLAEATGDCRLSRARGGTSRNCLQCGARSRRREEHARRKREPARGGPARQRGSRRDDDGVRRDPGGRPGRRRGPLREGIDELDRLGNASYRGTCCSCSPTCSPRAAPTRRRRVWCAAVRDTIRTDDLDGRHRALNALEGFLAAQRGELAEDGSGSARARLRVAATIDMYEHKAGAPTNGMRARSPSWASRTRRAKPRRPHSPSTRRKGDLPASAWARELLDSLAEKT